MKFIRTLIFLFAFSFPLFAQSSLLVKIENKTFNIPVYDRQGTLYFSIKHFAEALSINHFYNPETEKIELKFTDFNLKITAKNPYLVITSKFHFSLLLFKDSSLAKILL